MGFRVWFEGIGVKIQEGFKSESNPNPSGKFKSESRMMVTENQL